MKAKLQTPFDTLGVLAASPRLASVGTAVPPNRYTQQDVLDWAGETDPKVHALFRNSHILTRNLYLVEPVNGELPRESNEELIEKHLEGVLEIGPQAIGAALRPLGLEPEDIDVLVCVTSTGLLVPGVTAHLIKKMGMRNDIQRSDVVGMGCNAAVNAMQLVTATVQSKPDAIAVLLCLEICSSAYALDGKMSTAVVNSLFGDGAAAVVIRADTQDGAGHGPEVIDYQSFIHTETIDSMRYMVEGSTLSFHIDREIPFVIGRNAHLPVAALLERHDLAIADVDHWVIHSGGKKVIDAICANLGLSDHDVRHTRGVLRDQGNVSSASVLFAFERLHAEGVTKAGDVGVMIAMGPGMTIETALMTW